MNRYASYIACCLIGGFFFAMMVALGVCSLCQMEVSNLTGTELAGYSAVGTMLTGLILLVEDKRA
jgi:hypothetical protein